MVRWSVTLGLFLVLIGCMLGGIVWSRAMLEQKSEQVRILRVQSQMLEQQVKLLQRPELSPVLNTLAESIDTLRIRLVESLNQQPPPAGVLELNYAQSLMPRALGDESDDVVHILRLELTLALQHAVALLNIVQRIDESIRTWPHETRACVVHRVALQQLRAQCILDFYHWSRSQTHDDHRAQFPVNDARERS